MCVNVISVSGCKYRDYFRSFARGNGEKYYFRERILVCKDGKRNKVIGVNEFKFSSRDESLFVSYW